MISIETCVYCEKEIPSEYA